MPRSNRFYKLSQAIRENAIGDLEGLLAWASREAIPALKQIRQVLADFVERPEIPIFASSPVTDADYERGAVKPPRDGSLSWSSVDSKLYIRNGNATHEVVL